MDEDRIKFKVEFDAVSAGWGCIRIRAGRHEVDISTSYAFDPHEDLIKWLDKIISSKPESMVEIDEEGHVIQMIVSQKPEDNFLIFIIKDYDFPEELGSQEYLKLAIEKQVFINEFYNSFRAYLESTFVPDDWYHTLDVKRPDLLSKLKELGSKISSS